jgi:predicted transcriptional regulator
MTIAIVTAAAVNAKGGAEMAFPAPLGKTELEILRYIADHHPITVGEVAEHVAGTTGQARTTVLTTMERLRRKGYLSRKKVQGVYRYLPKLGKGELLRRLVGDFVDTTLGGSIMPFVAFLAESDQLSEDEVASLRKLVRDLEGPP